jgi:hypothetical protein
MPQVMKTEIFNSSAFKGLSPCFGIGLLDRLSLVGKNKDWMD